LHPHYCLSVPLDRAGPPGSLFSASQ
jgi:hypothetical protein